MNVLAGNNHQIFVNSGKQCNFMLNIEEDTIEGHLIWDARSFTNEKKEEIKSKIEECCLIDKIDVIDKNSDLVEWLENIFDNKFTFHIGGDYPISLPSFNIIHGPCLESKNVVSNVCWNPKNDLHMWEWLKSINICDLNIALSMYGDVNVHFVKNMRKQLDHYSMQVNSINAIFYNRRENFNENYGLFIVHFRKMIEFARILGAKYIIYGSTSSKFINTSQFESYVNKQKARCYFICAMNTICDIASKHNIEIIIKPNINSNFMTTNDEVLELIEEIKRDNLHMGNNRAHQVVSHRHFNLVEFNGSSLFNSIDSIKNYIAHLLFCELGSSGFEEKQSE